MKNPTLTRVVTRLPVRLIALVCALVYLPLEAEQEDITPALQTLWLQARYHQIALHHSENRWKRPRREQYMIATALCRINQRKGILHGHQLLSSLNREVQQSANCLECTAPIYRILKRELAYCVLSNLNRYKHRPPDTSLPDLLQCSCPQRGT